VKLPKQYLLSNLLSHNVRKNMALSFGVGETVWMHPPVHRILGWSTRPSNLNLKRNVWKLNQISQIVDNEIFVKGEPAISDLNTLNRFPNLLFANLINKNGLKIGSIADFLFDLKTGNILNYLISRSNPRIPGSSRWKLNIESITDQQPGLVFCSEESLDEFVLIKSSIKNEFLNKGKKFFNKFDDIKNIASSKLEDWLEEDTFMDNNYSPENTFVDEDESLDKIKNRDKRINSDAINSNVFNNRENDPWI
tara:strand:+ start:332 stop:1084 length:753 start_codon:yes stop_codon:yes gene_type:complete